MKKLFQLYKRYEMIINYLFIGGLTTLINFVTFFAMRYFGIGLVLTNTTANIVSVIFAFLPTKVSFSTVTTQARKSSGSS